MFFNFFWHLPRAKDISWGSSFAYTVHQGCGVEGGLVSSQKIPSVGKQAEKNGESGYVSVMTRVKNYCSGNNSMVS